MEDNNHIFHLFVFLENAYTFVNIPQNITLAMLAPYIAQDDVYRCVSMNMCDIQSVMARIRPTKMSPVSGHRSASKSLIFLCNLFVLSDTC